MTDSCSRINERALMDAFHREHESSICRGVFAGAEYPLRRALSKLPWKLPSLASVRTPGEGLTFETKA
jgi:hypothetical protein